MAVDWIEMKLPNLKQLGRFLAWALGRILFSCLLFVVDCSTHVLQWLITLLKWIRQATLNLIRVYDQLPYMGVAAQAIIDTKVIAEFSPNDIITDIVAAIESKQVMVIGEMGTGKSTIAQYLAYTVGGRVKVYECEGTPDDWAGLEVIGKGEDWAAINEGMQADLDDLSNQMRIRNERGDNALAGSEKVIICEEYPELVSKVEVSQEWLERHARRGRKARRFTILLSQYDRVSAWGLEGKSDLADAFYRIRLGKKAVSHAKSLKNDALTEWLKSDRSHCLLDDQPCKLPSYREMKAVTQRLYVTPVFQPVVMAELPSETGLQPPEMPENRDFEALARAVRHCLQAGVSESKIIKEVLGYRGGDYQKGKALLQELVSGDD